VLQQRRRFVDFLTLVIGFSVVASGLSSQRNFAHGAEMSPLDKEAQTLPGTAVGLLITTPGMTGQGAVPNTETQSMVFSRDGVRRFLYMLADQNKGGSKQYFYVGRKGVAQPFLNVVPSTPSILHAKGIEKEVALLEVEVNAGEGSPPLPLGENFVATKLRMLDGTEQYPFDALKVTDTAMDKCRGTYMTIKTADPNFASVARSVFGETSSETRSEVTTLEATWLSRQERLRVECQFRLYENKIEYGRGVSPQDEKSEPQTQGIPYGRRAGVLVTITVESDKNGQIKSVAQSTPEPYVIDIPPPGGASGSPPEKSD
jgi:hypothetical protein